MPTSARISTNREDLELLIQKLDDKEVDIVLGYVANLLLASAAKLDNFKNPPPPPPNVSRLTGKPIPPPPPPPQPKPLKTGC